jgi:exodeoxyribonuclease VII large subunit
VTVYPPRGEYQVVVRKVEPEGIGALELAFRQTVARLAAEGLFDPARKRPLPPYPRRIAVVTSPTGAAIRDLLQVTGRRWPAAEILIVPVKVQGQGAAAEVAAGIALANRAAGVELIIVARGGGSLEDLWAFNEEAVARAIFGSALPVVSAIGHEVDVTVADLVADVRALTPSEAGEICVPDAREVRARLDGLADRLARAALARVARSRSALEALADRAGRALHRDLDRRRDRLARRAAQLEALSPLAVLARGYSLTLAADGAVLRLGRRRPARRPDPDPPGPRPGLQPGREDEMTTGGRRGTQGKTGEELERVPFLATSSYSAFPRLPLRTPASSAVNPSPEGARRWRPTRGSRRRWSGSSAWWRSWRGARWGSTRRWRSTRKASGSCPTATACSRARGAGWRC